MQRLIVGLVQRCRRPFRSLGRPCARRHSSDNSVATRARCTFHTTCSIRWPMATLSTSLSSTTRAYQTHERSDECMNQRPAAIPSHAAHHLLTCSFTHSLTPSLWLNSSHTSRRGVMHTKSFLGYLAVTATMFYVWIREAKETLLTANRYTLLAVIGFVFSALGILKGGFETTVTSIPGTD